MSFRPPEVELRLSYSDALELLSLLERPGPLDRQRFGQHYLAREVRSAIAEANAVASGRRLSQNTRTD